MKDLSFAEQFLKLKYSNYIIATCVDIQFLVAVVDRRLLSFADPFNE